MKRAFWPLILLAAVLIIPACSDSPTDNNGGGNNLKGTYPLTMGTTWTYAGQVSYTQKVVGEKEINGKLYTEITNTAGPTGYVRYDGEKYYSPQPDGDGETVFFIDAPIGHTWSYVHMKDGALNKIDFTIAERGLERTIEGNDFTEVTRIEAVTSLFFPQIGEWTALLTSDYYFAQGIGFIELSARPPFNARVYLESYTIN